jgi:hypothetical protein
MPREYVAHVLWPEQQSAGMQMIQVEVGNSNMDPLYYLLDPDRFQIGRTSCFLEQSQSAPIPKLELHAAERGMSSSETPESTQDQFPDMA